MLICKLFGFLYYSCARLFHFDEQVLNSIDSESTNPILVIYQNGYLTIKGYDERFGIYRVNFSAETRNIEKWLVEN